NGVAAGNRSLGRNALCLSNYRHHVLPRIIGGLRYVACHCFNLSFLSLSLFLAVMQCSSLLNFTLNLMKSWRFHSRYFYTQYSRQNGHYYGSVAMKFAVGLDLDGVFATYTQRPDAPVCDFWLVYPPALADRDGMHNIFSFAEIFVDH